METNNLISSSPSGVETLISVDLSKSFKDQLKPIFHNRWHPDIPPVVTVEPKQIFRVECVDWTGGQINQTDDATDVKEVDLSVCHVLSGPIEVKGAEPGDALEVEILDVQSLPGQEWGYSGIFDKRRAGGFLCETYGRAAKAIWEFNGSTATSRHIPGVEFKGLIHPGILGCAPSRDLLKIWNARETKLQESHNKEAGVPAYALTPNPAGAFVGALEGTPRADEVKAEGARTIPPRENGGNCDIKNLTKGSKIWFPVYVPGANLSVGDIHFSQGDGEIAFCGGIEMSGAITLRTKILKNGVGLYNLRNPVFVPGKPETLYSNYLTFQGISLDQKGNQLFLDASASFKQACYNAIEYLKKFGYTGEQIYLLLTACPAEGKINSIVDIPNACCTLGVPTEIFQFPLLPQAGGPPQHPPSRGNLAFAKNDE